MDDKEKFDWAFDQLTKKGIPLGLVPAPSLRENFKGTVRPDVVKAVEDIYTAELLSIGPTSEKQLNEIQDKYLKKSAKVIRDFVLTAITERDGHSLRRLGDLVDSIAREELVTPDEELSKQALIDLIHTRCLIRFLFKNGRKPTPTEMSKAVNKQYDGKDLPPSRLSESRKRLGWDEYLK